MAPIANTRKSGFTVPELLIAMVLVGALVVPLAIISIYFMSSMFDRAAEATLTSEAQATLRTISEDLRNSHAILPSTTLTDPNHSPWSTNPASGILVFSAPALDNNRQIMTNGAGTTKYNEFIYFTENNNLYKRTLTPDESTSNLIKRTCPTSASSSSCVPDTELTGHLSSLTFTLYDKYNNITTDPQLANSVLANVKLSASSINGSVTVEKDIRVTIRRFE